MPSEVSSCRSDKTEPPARSSDASPCLKRVRSIATLIGSESLPTPGYPWDQDRQPLMLVGGGFHWRHPPGAILHVAPSQSAPLGQVLSLLVTGPKFRVDRHSRRQHRGYSTSLSADLRQEAHLVASERVAST